MRARRRRRRAPPRVRPRRPSSRVGRRFARDDCRRVRPKGVRFLLCRFGQKLPRILELCSIVFFYIHQYGKDMAQGSAKKTAARRVGAYVRVSTLAQAESGLGLDAQRDAIRRYAEFAGIEVVAEFCDAGESAGKPLANRPAGARLLEAIRSGELDGMIAARLDRVFRSCRDASGTAEEFDRRGWVMISATEAIDTSTPAGRMILQMLSSIGEFEREAVKARTKATAVRLAQEGRSRSNKAPFGWRLVAGPDSALASPPRDMETGEPMRVVADDRPGAGAYIAQAEARQRLAPCEAEARILRRMVRLRDRGLGAWRIANELNKYSRDRNPRTGRPWHYSTVGGILRTYDRRAEIGVAQPEE